MIQARCDGTSGPCSDFLALAYTLLSWGWNDRERCASARHMKVHRFAATDMSTALRQVREALGPQAIVLRARSGAEHGFWKNFKRPSADVLSAADAVVAESLTPGRMAVRSQATAAPEQATALRDIQRAIADMRARIDSLATRSQTAQVAHFGEHLSVIYRHLRSQDIDETLAYNVVQRVYEGMNPASLRSLQAVAARVRIHLSEAVSAAGSVKLTPGEPRVLFFVGPTGSGKTTLIAKLAAGFAVTEQRRVALITADTIRVASIPQIRTYGEIMGLDVEVAYSPVELLALVRKHKDKDLILVDTPGRSPRDRPGIDEVALLVRQIPGALAYLVLSATSKSADLIAAAEAFEPCAFTHLAVSRLDETDRIGPLFELAARAKRPFGFFSLDQDVPGLIEVASAGYLVDRVLEGLDTEAASTPT